MRVSIWGGDAAGRGVAQPLRDAGHLVTLGVPGSPSPATLTECVT